MKFRALPAQNAISIMILRLMNPTRAVISRQLPFELQDISQRLENGPFSEASWLGRLHRLGLSLMDQ